MKTANLMYAPLLLFQLGLMALYYVFVRYPNAEHSTPNQRGFEDTHVMIFIGFGFLMTFLKKYCYSALGFNWFLAALTIQWALLCQQFFHMKDNVIFINKESILEADVMSATVLITFGAVLGRASGLQLLFIAIVEISIGCCNMYLVADVFKAADVGGSIAIHAFGAYFGLGCSLGLKPKKPVQANAPEASTETVPSALNKASYVSDTTAMIGSIFLWIYWPSFNSALTKSPAEYERAVVNTYLCLAAATVTTFIVSSCLSHHDGKLDMVHVQNSTLAGGVAVGSVCNMMIGPGSAIAIGIVAGALSVAGYNYLTPRLDKYGVLDTCGVNNLHGMPGVLSGLISVVVASLATSGAYGSELTNVFPDMKDGGRTAQQQALYQLAALAATIVISFISGVLTGFVAKISILKPLKQSEHYDDEVNWELP